MRTRNEKELNIYEKVKALFDEEGILSGEDIDVRLNRAINHSTLSILRALGYITVTLDGNYKKVKDFPETVSEVEREYRGSKGPKALRLRAFRHPEEFKTTSYQVGGSHYRRYKYQPLMLSIVADMAAVQLFMLKYVLRYKDKNGMDDLKKAKHLCDMCMEIKYVRGVPVGRLYLVEEFIRANELDETLASLTEGIAVADWPTVAKGIEALMEDCKTE